MKRIVCAMIALLFTGSLANLRAESPEHNWRQSEGHWAFRNSISAGVGGMVGTAYNGMGIFPVSLEFDRFFSERFSWGISCHYSDMKGRLATDTPTVRENFLLLSGKISYTLPIVRNILYLKAGAGIGVGYHRINEASWGEIVPEEYEGREREVRDRLLPHLLVDLHLLIRVTRRIDVMVSPLIVTPSRFIYTPFSFDDPYKSHYYNFDFGRLAVGFRF